MIAAARRPARCRSLRRAAFIPLRLPAEIRAPLYRPSVPLLRCAAALQLARHAVRPSAAARSSHHMRQRDKRPALLFRARGAFCGQILRMLDGGKPRLVLHRSPQARLPSVSAAVPLPPLLRGWRRRLWLPLGDQRKLKNKSPAGAPAIQLAAKLCPWVDNRLCRLFIGGRFFGAARSGCPRDAPSPRKAYRSRSRPPPRLRWSRSIFASCSVSCVTSRP